MLTSTRENRKDSAEYLILGDETSKTTAANDELAAAQARADWRSVEQLYRQFSAIANDPEETNVIPIEVAGALAESSGRVLAHYDRLERKYMDDLLHIWSHIDNLGGAETERFRRLYEDSRLDRFLAYRQHPEQRRRPKPFEASIETCRRLIDLNRIRDALTGIQSSGALGGSVSYGRFFNVQGAVAARPPAKASDTDLLLVLSEYAELTKLPAALSNVDGLDKESLKHFGDRIRAFSSMHGAHDRCIFSHKLKFWEDTADPYLAQHQYAGHYLLSLHVFSWEDFEFLILKDKRVLEPDIGGQFTRDIYDYRDTEPTRLDNLRAFSGVDYSIPLETQKVDSGYLLRVRVCHIVEDRFCPGLHQNIILPQFEIRWEAPTLRITLPLLGFRWKILERLREERRLRPYEIQNLPLSHTRHAIFAPHINRRAGRE